MFGSRIRLKPLALACRSLSTMLGSGVGIQTAFELAAEKTSDQRCARVMDEIGIAVRRGEEVSAAMRRLRYAFPELLVDMVDVAEQTGTLPEMLQHLADHYENNLRLKKRFLMAIAWPAFQLVAAILVIAMVIFLLGWIAELRGGEPVDILGWGLTGSSGAVIWLTSTFGSFLALFVVYQILVKAFSGKRFLDPVLMKIPVLGTCMQSFAIARFSWALYLTQQSGMPIDQSLEASLRATSNGAFMGASGLICGMIKSGEHLSDALEHSRLFPVDFIQMVKVAETSGTVPEVLNRLSPQFEEQARRSLSVLTSSMGWLVWAFVAAIIIFMIFSVALWYIGMIEEATRGI